MKLPIDMTEQEMKDVMQDIWKEYAPEANSEFINELNKEQLTLLFDLISTKDSIQREAKLNIVQQKIHDSSQTFIRILQKLKLIQIQFEEKKEQENEDLSIDRLESQF